MMKQYSRCGFTLIELLVVIAIIAILAAILFPIFTAAKERARTAACSSNLHQIGAAFTQYCDDNSGKVPLAADAEDWYDNPPNASIGFPFPFPWTAMKAYTKSSGIWRCPSDKGFKWLRTKKGDVNWPTLIKNCYLTWGSSYSYRTALVIKNWDTRYSTGTLTAADIKPCTISQLFKASRVIVFFDPLQYSEANPPPATQWQAQWHTFKYPTMGWNCAFADGHASLITKNQLYHPTDNPYNRWLLSDYYIRPEYPN
jgi:prepilin-type N-terminal cleavage/methylation domain-containing protein/prepilin-type processing-associated H-X9-DG protein